MRLVARWFVGASICAILLPCRLDAQTVITNTRAEVSFMASLWEANTIQISSLANTQYPSIGGGTSNWQFIFGSFTVGDGDIHVPMAIDSSGTGSSGNNTGFAPINGEVINWSGAQFSNLTNGTRAVPRGIFRWYSEHLTSGVGERHFEIHPMTELLKWNGSAFVATDDYRPNIKFDDGNTTQSTQHMITTFDGSDIMTAAVMVADSTKIVFTYPSPRFNYCIYDGVTLSGLTNDSVSQFFWLKPSLVPTAVVRCRIITNTVAATVAAGLVSNQVVSVNALTRCDLLVVSNKIAALTAGQTGTFTWPVELITLNFTNVGALPPPGSLTNSWKSVATGKWETASNWSAGTPSLTDAVDLIENPTAATTVTIDAVTTSTPSSLTISNLTVLGPGVLNTLQLTNAGTASPLTILNSATIGSFGALLVSNSAMRVTSSLALGTLTVQSGALITASGSLTLGDSAGARGTLWMTGGSLVATNNTGTGFIIVGNAGTGAMTVSNGTARFDQMFAGDAVGGVGTITIAGGTNLSPSTFVLGQSTFSTGTVWVTSGVVALTNNFRTAFIEIAGNGAGQTTVSNGLVLVDRVFVASLSSMGRGTLTAVGGTTIINTNMVLGSGCGSLGNLVVAGGNVFVTNATGTAVLEVRGGILELDSGTLVIDKLVMTNSCGQFIRTGGTLSITTTNLGANLDADGDGLPNGWEQQYGFNPLSSIGAGEANADPDGDGMSNLQEFLAGTDPTNSASHFHITSVVNTGSDVLVSWMMGPGKTNALQWTAGTGDGSYQTNGFTDLFIVTNTVGFTTNHLDVGGATNTPSRYYRVRLVP